MKGLFLTILVAAICAVGCRTVHTTKNHQERTTDSLAVHKIDTGRVIKADTASKKTTETTKVQTETKKSESKVEVKLKPKLVNPGDSANIGKDSLVWDPRTGRFISGSGSVITVSTDSTGRIHRIHVPDNTSDVLFYNSSTSQWSNLQSETTGQETSGSRSDSSYGSAADSGHVKTQENTGSVKKEADGPGGFSLGLGLGTAILVGVLLLLLILWITRKTNRFFN